MNEKRCSGLQSSGARGPREGDDHAPVKAAVLPMSHESASDE